MTRTVFIVSDRTGITVQTLSRSLLTQFDGIDFEQVVLPFIDSPEAAERAVNTIRLAAANTGHRPIVYSSLIDDRLRAILAGSGALCFDFFETFIGPLERVFGAPSSHLVGRSHGMDDLNRQMTRMDAVNYSLVHDDGLNTQGYEQADVILLGLSRAGKTPTCLYMAMSFGVRAANYPLTEEDLESPELPEDLEDYRERLFGLTIDASRLQSIRQVRRANSRYASLTQCHYEVSRIESMFRREGIDNLNTTALSIEEISTDILLRADIKRRLY